MLRTTRNIRFSESRQLYERSDPSPHNATTYLEKWSCKTNTLRMTGSSFRGTVSSIEVKSTCSNSPGPLQVRGCMGAIGGAASNLRQRPHFPDTITEVPGHTWPPESLLHQRGGPALALVCRLAMATVHCCTAVPLRHHKLKDGLLGRPDIWSCDTGGRS